MTEISKIKTQNKILNLFLEEKFFRIKAQKPVFRMPKKEGSDTKK